MIIENRKMKRERERERDREREILESWVQYC